jgi:hypothetical protein
VSGRERAEDGSAGHRRAGHDGRDDGLVGRPQPVAVLQGHHPAAGQQPGEHDEPRGGGEDGHAGGRGEVDPAMARSEAVRRLEERPDHARDRRPERPRVRGAGRGCPWRGCSGRGHSGRAPRRPGRVRRHHAHEPDEHRHQHRARPPPRVTSSRGASCAVHARHAGPATASAAVPPPGCGWWVAHVDNRGSGRDATEAAGHPGRMLDLASRHSR